MSYRYEMTLSNLLRHAFMSGAGYGGLDKISEEDQSRWTHYEHPQTDQVKSFLEAVASLDKAPNAPQDMNLVELVVHLARCQKRVLELIGADENTPMPEVMKMIERRVVSETIVRATSEALREREA